MKKENKKEVYLASDHAGWRIKEKLKGLLKEEKINLVDLGPERYVENDDYPDYAKKVAEKISKNPKERGVLICGTGQGMCITANKFRKVYASLAYDPESARHSKKHNKSNVLCIPGDLSGKKAGEIARTWIREKESSAKRHERRINKIKKIEKQNFK